MTPIELGSVIIGTLFVLLLVGMPIAFALMASGMLGIFIARGPAGFEYVLATFPYSYVANFAFIVVPLFMFMSQLAFATGMSRQAFKSASIMTNGLRGGLATATVFACGVFSTVSGSSIATASSIAHVAIPEMRAAGYSDRLAAACVAAGGTLGVLIPPSSILVIYGLATGTSVVQLFVGALIPGVLTALAYIVGIIAISYLSPKTVGRSIEQGRVTMAERFSSLLMTWDAALLFLLVIGSIYLGLATPNEAAALGAFAVLAMALFKPGRFAIIWAGLRQSGSITCAVFGLIIGAGLFSMALTTSRLPVEIAQLVSGFDLPVHVLVLLILVPFLFLGAFIDGISMVLLTMPIVFPIVEHVGVNPVLFGILVVKAVEIGLITPPVGLNVFVVKGSVPDLPLKEVFIGCIPFVLLEIGLIVLFLMFPEIVLWPL
ncbi:TRAP transporter large permease [Afifella pfennigii]|uniref:TRAP transporter large permease n=1 Tax=Afifella pfennigii TaxID=209897 RepID=UPI00047C8DB6|nr:TRAP transporter large permease [Afifella pfennigii]